MPDPSSPPSVFSANDLIEKPETFRELEPPAILGVFGDPVEHSLSPGFQNAGLKAAGISGQYVRIHASAEDLPAAVKSLSQAGFVGANVTIPHKAAALELVDEASDAASQSGGVNTIVVEDQQLLGFSTDGPGLVQAIREEFYVDIRDLNVLLLGAGGGAGRAAAVQCAREGCQRLVLANRTVDRAQALAGELRPFFLSEKLAGPTERLVAISLDAEEIAREIERVDLVINATPLGMKRTDPSPLPVSVLTPNLMVYDMVYSGGSSRLAVDANSVGARVSGGLSMLLYQGALSFETWFNQPAPLSEMREALLKSAEA